MIEAEPTKPQKGAWANFLVNAERAPKVKFELNVPEIVTFTSEPIEGISEAEDGVYYTIHCIHKDVQTVIQTSAWTLLRELAKFAPLEGKKICITKKIDKGKQYFEVIKNL